jgi:DNA-3-methyladenine glycosylase I
LLKDPGIIRNKLKIAATIGNAKAYLALTKEDQTFNDFVWQFVNHTPIQNNRQSLTEVPTKTAESDAMSKALQKIGFKFVGSTICYAFMQASGMVNDHLVTCHRHATVQQLD